MSPSLPISLAGARPPIDHGFLDEMTAFTDAAKACKWRSSITSVAPTLHRDAKRNSASFLVELSQRVADNETVGAGGR